MTTIAYRNGILAADTATFIHEGNTRVPEGSGRKIVRLSDGSCVAGSGIKREISEFARWCETGNNPEKRPSFDLSTVIRVWPDGRGEVYDGKYDERDISGCEFYAIGSGSAAALGAMYAGASASEAVQIAMKIDPWTDGEVQIEPLVLVALAAE